MIKLLKPALDWLGFIIQNGDQRQVKQNRDSTVNGYHELFLLVVGRDENFLLEVCPKQQQIQ